MKVPRAGTRGGREVDSLCVRRGGEPGRRESGSLFGVGVGDTRGMPEPEFLDQTPLGADCETLAPGIGRATAGASRGAKFCSSCGVGFDKPAAKFCAFCGAKRG